MILMAWQVAEHINFQRTAKNTLVLRARNTTSTLSRVVRARSFFGVIDPRNLDSALNELVQPGEFNPNSVVLLNADNERVAAGGAEIDPQLEEKLLDENILWDDKAQTLTVLNVVDLGTNIVASPREIFRPPRQGTNAPTETNGIAAETVAVPATSLSNSTPQPAQPVVQEATSVPAVAATNISVASTNTDGERQGNRGRRGRGRGGRGGGDQGGDPRSPFRKPEWMSQQAYESLIQKQGVHGVLIVLSSSETLAAINKDLWMRIVIAILGTIGVAGYGLAWGSLKKTSDLQIRLVRASELNAHLKEMNLAAAGLAHETRNPLNIVRGLAQMISRRDDATPEVRAKTREIMDETDRVTGQLNEFINYSRPREVRRAATNLNGIMAEVVRALNYDIDEKKVLVQIKADPITIQADEQLLRQALFNLVLNAIQAVPSGGEIQLRAGRVNGNGVFVEVADNGPGVAAEHRAELFKPYFTTHAEGTGLGLAVVQQIVLAHGWEIQCLPNEPRGARFRITHIRSVH